MMTPLDYVFSNTHSLLQLHNEESYFPVSTSLKNETGHENSSFPVSSSLKNETNPLLIKMILPFDLVKVNELIYSQYKFKPF